MSLSGPDTLSSALPASVSHTAISLRGSEAAALYFWTHRTSMTTDHSQPRLAALETLRSWA